MWQCRDVRNRARQLAGVIFLRVVRAALIFLGTGAAAFGTIMIAVDARMTCKTDSATYAGPGRGQPGAW
ncbi:hypothetical protein EDD40_3536 [Saccharothrix texasensis]|uniref:Uncharacterized protein n=1 Tax=Saccharothrix texasensis TaxID=103734 RepID=A0A3N1H6M8_9PSEU|nr:hypothetical protein EDD40_3536 [Saccharothrix texasensis]